MDLRQVCSQGRLEEAYPTVLTNKAKKTIEVSRTIWKFVHMKGRSFLKHITDRRSRSASPRMSSSLTEKLERDQVVMTLLLTQLANPSQVSALVTRCVDTQVDMLTKWWRFKDWWNKTFPASEIPTDENCLQKNMRGTGAQVFDGSISGTRTTMEVVKKGENIQDSVPTGFIDRDLDTIIRMQEMSINPLMMGHRKIEVPSHCVGARLIIALAATAAGAIFRLYAH